MKKILFLFALVALLTGCSTLRNDQPYRPNEPLAVTAKISADLEANTLNQSLGGTLRLQRDRQVQLSLSKYGIEGARIIFTPDSVIVYATKKVLDSIHKAQTEKLNVGNFTEPKEITVNLAKIAKAKFVPAQVKIKLFPDVLTEEKVEVPIEPTNVPENKVLRTFPGKITVSFVVGAQRLRTLPKDLTTKELLPTGFKVVVDYNEVMTRHTEKCRLYLLATPNGVRNARLATNYIDYIIEQR